jgi:hypothetical protein
MTQPPVPAGLNAGQWHYFAVFASAIVAMVLTTLPGGAIGLIAVTFIAAMRYVDPDAGQRAAPHRLRRMARPHRGRFWWLGLVFGLVFFAALAGVAGPRVMATMPVQ